MPCILKKEAEKLGCLQRELGRLGGSHQRVQLSQGLPTALPQDAPELSQPCFWCCVLILVCAFTSSLPFSGDVKGKEAVSLKFRNLANTPLEETGRAEGQDHSLGFKYNEQAFPPTPTLTPTHLHPPPLCTRCDFGKLLNHHTPVVHLWERNSHAQHLVQEGIRQSSANYQTGA